MYQRAKWLEEWIFYIYLNFLKLTPEAVSKYWLNKRERFLFNK